ncbi:MAG: transporter, partial [Actinotalea sp.]|nr:transporter [Actinotalea sp.]
DGLAQAAGLASVIRTVEEALGAGWAPPVSGPGPLQPDRVAAVRSAWVADAGGHLPERWRAALDDSVASAEVLTATLDAALGAVVLGSRPPAGPRAARLVAGVVGVVALLGLGLLTGVLVGGGGPQVTILAVASCAALGVAAALVWWSGRLRRAEARRRAADLGVRARAAIHEVAAELVVGPTTSVLDDHDAVRSTAQAVAASTGAAAAVPSPA